MYDSIEVGNSYDSLSGAHFDYEYPDPDLDWDPKGKLHRKTLARLMRFAEAGNALIRDRAPQWAEIDKTLQAYMPLDEAEYKVRHQDSRKPLSIVYPYSYAILETLTSHMDAAFLMPPIFRYSGMAPEDTIGAGLLELVIDQQCRRNKVPLAMHTFFADGLRYGIGVGFPQWKRHWGFQSNVYEAPGAQSVYTVKQETLKFEGNALKTIDPYRFLPDPNVSVQDVQNGEFVGFVERTNILNLLSAEGDGTFFNVKYVKKCRIGKTDLDVSPNYNYDIGDYFSPSRDQFNRSLDANDKDGRSSAVDVIYLYVNLIPKDWKLGDDEYPQKWFFAIAGDKVIIGAARIDLDHNMFPIAVNAPTYDGYSSLPISKLELTHGMQVAVNYMFNSHIANVRKAVNDMIIFDPMMINENDLKNPEPGKLIRVRRPAMGKGGIDQYVKQLNINDITRANIADANALIGLMHKISGADEALMGSLREGGPERLTAGEFQGTRSSQMTRLEGMVNAVAQMGQRDLAYMFAVHCQQLMSKPVWVEAVGQWAEVLSADLQDGRMIVDPTKLNVDFDVVMDDARTNKDGHLQFWFDTWQTISENPLLATVFDQVRIFKHMARGAGAINVDQFVRQPQIQPMVAPDQLVQDQVQAGNLVPVGGMVDALG